LNLKRCSCFIDEITSVRLEDVVYVQPVLVKTSKTVYWESSIKPDVRSTHC